MNIYVLIEDEVGVKRIYQNWITYVNPGLKCVEHPSELVNNNFVVLSGQGYPQYIKRLKNALADAKKNPAIDRLVVSVDSEDWTFEERYEKIADIVRTSRIKKEVRIVVQHFCFETWALGNKAVIRRRTKDVELAHYRSVYDVFSEDPELLPEIDEMNRSTTAFEYLRKILRDRSPKLFYTKSDPGDVAKMHYYQKVVDRQTTTGHIASFIAFQDAFPPRQNSCRLLMMLNLGAIRMRDGTVRRRIQEQGGGEVVAAGERRYLRSFKRGWGFGADIGAVA